MSFYDKIDKKFQDHPLLKGYKNFPEIRENLVKYAQELSELDLSDAFTMKNKIEKRDLRTMVFEASKSINDLFSGFDLPIFPKISLNNAKEVTYSRHNASEVAEGIIDFNVELVAKSGVKKTARIPVVICEGEIVPPSIMSVDGSIYLISQDSINEILERITAYQLEPLRKNMFAPPLNRAEKEIAVQVRNELGWQAIERDNKRYMQQRTSSDKEAVKSTPAGFELVVKEMKEAQEKLEDTFPRPYAYIERNYILKHVSMASKNNWEPHLINLGLCINTWGKAPSSRAVVTANKKAQEATKEADLEKEIDLEVSEPPVEVDESFEQNASDIFYSETKTPIEIGDRVKLLSENVIGKVSEIDSERSLLIVDVKGTEYRVSVEDIKPLSSTFKKMYL